MKKSGCFLKHPDIFNLVFFLKNRINSHILQNNFIHLTFGYGGSLLLHKGFSLVAAESGSNFSFQCTCFSLQWVLLFGAQALGSWASAVAARGHSSCGSWALDHKLSSCGAWACWPLGMWDPSSPTRDHTQVSCIGR